MDPVLEKIYAIKKYELDIEVKSIVEVVAGSII